MPSNYKTAAPARNAAMDALGARLNGGRIEVSSAAPAALVTDPTPGTVLAILGFGNPAFGAAANGVLTANAITADDDANAGGDAASFRFFASAAADTACESQGTAGALGDTPDMEFDNKTIVLNGTVQINTLTITMPEQ